MKYPYGDMWMTTGVDWVGGAGWGDATTKGNVLKPTTSPAGFIVRESHCHWCRRRQTYVMCAKCGRSLCAPCSWTSPHAKGANEHCRECAGVQW